MSTDKRRTERKLAAILAADAAGYSGLMEKDEEGTLRRWNAYRGELLDPKIVDHRGRVFKAMGDGLLVEFKSAVEAVACALEIQTAMIARNGSTPQDERIRIRIGINVGDIIIEGEDVHGDGVNVAARLEKLAEPDDICVSSEVRNHVGNRLPVIFEDLGEKELKSLERPVRVYRVRARDQRSGDDRLRVHDTETVAARGPRLEETVHSSRKFRDAVFNYIYASTLENTIIQHPLVNRLHEIRQNASTYLTYPGAHGMRFAHSLGTMHVAGLLITHALQLTTSDIRTEVAEMVQQALSVGGKPLNEMQLILLNEKPLLEHDWVYKQNGFVPCDSAEDLAVLVLFQAVRLACLVHDIGHPPFSHTVESALNQALPSQYQGHEQIGLKILDHIISQFDRNHPLFEFAASVFVITKLIVNKRPPFQGIATLVSGDIDADRVDYVRRDMMLAGLSPTSYDLGRLLDSTMLRKNQNTGVVEVAFTTGSLSMMEAFFYARFHLYRYMLWHHNVIRTNLGLSRALFHLLTAAQDDLPPEALHLGACIKDIATLAAGNPVVYEDFTDGYLVTQLREILRAIEGGGQQSGRQRMSTPATKTIHRAMQVFLRRRTNLLPALWKRPDQYHDFASLVLSYLDREENGATATNPIGELNQKLIKAFEVNKTLAAWSNEDHANKLFCQKIEDALRGSTPNGSGEKFWAYFITPKFRPTPKDGIPLVSPNRGRDLNLHMLSPTVASLQQAWLQLPHLWLYIENDHAHAIDIQPIRTVAAERLARFLGTMLR